MQETSEEWRIAEAETVRAEHEARRAETLAAEVNAEAGKVDAARKLR